MPKYTCINVNCESEFKLDILRVNDEFKKVLLEKKFNCPVCGVSQKNSILGNEKIKEILSHLYETSTQELLKNTFGISRVSLEETIRFLSSKKEENDE